MIITNGSAISESKKNEGWLFNWSSREDLLADVKQELEKNCKVIKQFGNWFCIEEPYNNNKPTAVEILIRNDDGQYGYKDVDVTAGPLETNTAVAKWLKPRLEKWEIDNNKITDHETNTEWVWINKCLGIDDQRKNKKSMINSLQKGDKIKLIPTVANGAIVTFVQKDSPSTIIVDYNGKMMRCKIAYVESKVGESGTSEKRIAQKFGAKNEGRAIPDKTLQTIVANIKCLGKPGKALSNYPVNRRGEVLDELEHRGLLEPGSMNLTDKGNEMAKEWIGLCEESKNESKEMTEEAVCELFDELNLVVDNKWFDGDNTIPVFDCRDSLVEMGETVSVRLEPPYEARVWYTDRNPRNNGFTEGIETIEELKNVLKKFFAIDESMKSEAKKIVDNGFVSFSETKHPHELRKLYKACKDRFGVSDYVSYMKEDISRDGADCQYKINGITEDDKPIIIEMNYYGDSGDYNYEIDVSLLETAGGSSLDSIGNGGPSHNFDKALNSAMASVDKYLQELPIRNDESKKSEGRVSPYLVDVAHKILKDEYGWTASTTDEVAEWLADHKSVFEHAYGEALREYDDDYTCVKAGIDAVLDDEDRRMVNAEIAMMGEKKSEALNFGGFKNMLQTYNVKGGSVKNGPWRICDGANDLWFELYYNETPILGCIENVCKWYSNPETVGMTLEDYKKIEELISSEIFAIDTFKMPESKKHETREDGERDVDDYDTMRDGLKDLGFELDSDVRNGKIYPYRRVSKATKNGVTYSFMIESDGEYTEDIVVYGGKFDRNERGTRFNNVTELLNAMKSVSESKKSESKKNEEFETIADREIQVRKPGQSWARWTVTWPEYVEMHKQDAKDKGWPEIRVRKLALNGRDAEVIEGPDESKKSEANIEDLRDKSISSGTLKSTDYLPKFLNVLKTYAPDKYDSFVKENPEVNDLENTDPDTLSWLESDIFDLMQTIAPDGTTFGSSEGDGADFGFWSIDEKRKKQESLTLKLSDLKRMAKYDEATDITTISDAEAKELKSKGIELVGVSRGTYGMNGALLRDNDGKKYVITARSTNLFYFV